MKKILLVMVLLLVLSFLFIAFRFGGALTQEGNPIPILSSIVKLELSNHAYKKIADTNKELTYVSKHKKQHTYGIVKEFMKGKGWDFKEQMGSGFIFEKNKETIVIETKQYSRHYFLWDVPKEVIN